MTNTQRRLGALLALGMLWSGAAQAASEVAARVGSWTLTVEEVDKAIHADLYDLQKKIYQLRMAETEDRVVDHLLELEAKKQGITGDELWKKEVTDRAGQVSDEEIKGFMMHNASRLPNGGQGMEDQIRSFLNDKREKPFAQSLMQRLTKSYGTELVLAAPAEPRYSVRSRPTEDAMGPKDAPVTIVEFSDFECPYCRRVQPALEEVKKAYGDKVRLVFRHFPLSFHKLAPKASLASMCAGDQGKFWPYHDKMFEEGVDLQPAGLQAAAKALKLDMAAFDKCLSDEKYDDRLQADMAEASRLGITGTPTFLINGIKISGALPFAMFKQRIDTALEEAGK
uniref:Thioredoxin domain-containing protein n=1 Tax=Magnetococcus massalia (strain MO-1) TaxID=451514 RepID=A0A1S7LLY9_MAGMO|nr:Protein of unknown function. Containing thioredoxin fold [Candidatus Magnetococcus massalia]